MDGQLELCKGFYQDDRSNVMDLNPNQAGFFLN